MKTPRELILERHRSAEAKLAGLIRAEELAANARMADQRGEACRPRSIAFAARKFWEEAVRPWRRVWVGLAAVWLAILALNVSTTESPGGVSNVASEPSAKILTAWREQKQLMAQFLEPGGPSAALPAKLPRPRGALPPFITLV